MKSDFRLILSIIAGFFILKLIFDKEDSSAHRGSVQNQSQNSAGSQSPTGKLGFQNANKASSVQAVPGSPSIKSFDPSKFEEEKRKMQPIFQEQLKGLSFSKELSEHLAERLSAAGNPDAIRTSSGLFEKNEAKAAELQKYLEKNINELQKDPLLFQEVTRLAVITQANPDKQAEVLAKSMQLHLDGQEQNQQNLNWILMQAADQKIPAEKFSPHLEKLKKYHTENKSLDSFRSTVNSFYPGMI